MPADGVLRESDERIDDRLDEFARRVSHKALAGYSFRWGVRISSIRNLQIRIYS
jgi:hypothetical protein